MTGPQITVQAESMGILGVAAPITMTLTLVDPNQTGGLKVVAQGLIPAKSTQSVNLGPPSATATVGPIFGNDVIEDANNNVGLSYYYVAVYANGSLSGPIFTGNYQFTGSGTVDILTATQYNPVTGPINNPLVPANEIFAGPTTGSAAAPGFRALVAADIAFAVLPAVPVTDVLSGATISTTRIIDSEPSITHTGSTTITGSVAAVRGNITQGSTNILSSGFEYGVQGKLTLAGTLANGSGFNYGIFGQIDTSAATFVHTSGYLAPIGADFGATSIMASDALANMISLTNTTSCIIHSALQFIGNASYALDLQDLASGGKHFITTGASGGSNTKCLVVLIDGTPMKIQLYA
jgi:hypothetical protein